MDNTKILLKDPIYGKFFIDSPVLIELINSKPLQRLKKLNQYGIPDEFYHLKNHGSRYNHSLGVMLLLKRLGASEEEQIAGLTHDISHTAFSHVIDWVFGKGETEEFQNQQHEKFLLNSEVVKILKKYGLDPKQIASHKHFKLLEQKIPNLCADRIDYAIKEFPKKIAKLCLKNFIVKDRKIIFKNKKAAKVFARNFLKRHLKHWGEFEAVARYGLLAKALQIALKEKIIKFDDFWQYDKFIIEKLKKSKNNKIKKILSILREKSLKKLPVSKKVVHKKFRYVDPEFIKNGKLVKLSNVNKKFQNELKEAEKINKQGVHLPRIN